MTIRGLARPPDGMDPGDAYARDGRMEGSFHLVIVWEECSQPRPCRRALTTADCVDAWRSSLAYPNWMGTDDNAHVETSQSPVLEEVGCFAEVGVRPVCLLAATDWKARREASVPCLFGDLDHL